jgi:hypothetical protein
MTAATLRSTGRWPYVTFGAGAGRGGVRAVWQERRKTLAHLQRTTASRRGREWHAVGPE